MEADWEVEIGAESPVIDVAWSGFVELQQNPDRIDEISESRGFPCLAAALLSLNAQTTFPGDQNELVLQTVKCDLWPTGPCDPSEMDATPDTSGCGIACYIDLVPRNRGFFPSLLAAESWARLITSHLKMRLSPASRVDLIVRQAVTLANSGFGITAYISACGATMESSKHALGTALEVFTETISNTKNPSQAQSAPAMNAENDTMTTAGE